MVVVWLCLCGGVFAFLCFGDVFVLVLLCFCDGVVVLLWWCGGVSVFL